MTEKELLDCFRHMPDGTWLCVKPVLMPGSERNSALMPGVTVHHGDIFMGRLLARELDEAEARRPH